MQMKPGTQEEFRPLERLLDDFLADPCDIRIDRQVLKRV
jgi:hypothetical protein